MPHQPRKLLPSILGAIGIMLWATETALITYTTSIPPLQTVGLAFGFAALMSPAVWWITQSSPLEAFRQPPKVWLLTVVSLVGYHACIYYATQNAPPAAAALLQGTTPLIIVIGSAFLPGEKLRWWHLVGAGMGLCGVIALIDQGDASGSSGGAAFYLSLIGIAAGLWGLYSVVSRSFGDVPSSALGVFYAASALVSMTGHFALETWVQPDQTQWLAIAGLGLLPMGIAIYFWDFGCKKGDIQALGAFSYVEPFIGAVLVALIGQGALSWTLFWSGCLVIGGAGIASAGLWKKEISDVRDAISEAEKVRVPEEVPELSADIGLAARQLAEHVGAMLHDQRARPADITRIIDCYERLARLWSGLNEISNPCGRFDDGIESGPLIATELGRAESIPKSTPATQVPKRSSVVRIGPTIQSASLRSGLDEIRARIDLSSGKAAA